MTPLRSFSPINPPPELLNLQAWVAWKYIQKPNKDKLDKVPFYCDNTPRQGVQNTDRDIVKMLPYKNIHRYTVRMGADGIGFCPRKELGFAVIDFDNCVINGQVVEPIATLIKGTYSEFSPSGTGVHAFYKGDLGNKKDCVDVEKDPTKVGVETFSSAGFVTFSGHLTPQCIESNAQQTVADIPSDMLEYVMARFPEQDEFQAELKNNSDYRPDISLEQIGEWLEYLDPNMRRDPWKNVGMAIHYHTRGSDEGKQLWGQWSSKATRQNAWSGWKDIDAVYNSFKLSKTKVVTIRTLVKMAKAAGAPVNLPGLSISDINIFDFTSGQPIEADIEPERPKPSIEPVDVEPVDQEQPQVPAPQIEQEFNLLVPIGKLMSRKPAQYLIKGLIEMGTVGAVYGQPGAGKSFLTIDQAFAIAAGFTTWFGYRIKQAKRPIIYYAGEGVNGIAKRLKALSKQYNVNLDSLPFYLIEKQIDVASIDSMTELVKDMELVRRQHGTGPAAIYIDTLARASVSTDENDATEVQAAVSVLDQVLAAVNRTTTIVLVHHSGKDKSRGLRGSNALSGAMDWVISVERDRENDTRSWFVEKCKDGVDGQDHSFSLDVVEIGMADEDGDIPTSCIVREVTEQEIVQEGIEIQANQAIEKISSTLDVTLDKPTKNPAMALFGLIDCMRQNEKEGRPLGQINAAEWKKRACQSSVDYLANDCKPVSIDMASESNAYRNGARRIENFLASYPGLPIRTVDGGGGFAVQLSEDLTRKWFDLMLDSVDKMTQKEGSEMSVFEAILRAK